MKTEISLVFKWARQWSIPWARCIQSPASYYSG